MGWDSEEVIDNCYEEYKRGLFGKKYTISLLLYPSHIEGKAIELYEDEWPNSSTEFHLSFNVIEKVYEDKMSDENCLCIDFKKNSIIGFSHQTMFFPGIKKIDKWIHQITTARNQYIEALNNKQQLKVESQERRRQLEIEMEEKALKFYKDCYSFHIKENTPTYLLFEEKNRTAVIYIGEDKSINFLKIDGYGQEESNGVIQYQNIHYYEKAGDVHYATDIHGQYTNFGGSVTGGNFSKLAAVGGGLLFGVMGMALGATLTYEPIELKNAETRFQIDSDIKKIDDRSVILNFYSDMKKQYVDIELPQDIFNFLQTYLPEKKYGIVNELEKKTAVHQSADLIESGSLFKVSIGQASNRIETKSNDSTEDFANKIKKLKMMKEAGLLSDKEFAEQKAKLIDSI